MVHSWRDNISLSDEQRHVRDSIQELCADFDAKYWREKDRDEEYPAEFVNTLSRDGWLGILIPKEYTSKGYGTEETVVMMNEIAASGAEFSGAQTIHAAIYNSAPS